MDFMNRNFRIIIIVIVLAIVGGFAVLQFTKPDKQTNSNSAPNEPVSQTNDETINTDARAGKYIDYSPDAIAQSDGTKILFFYAPWCPQCRAVEADIKNDGVPNNVTIIKVDYDTSQTLRQKYGVTIQTTFVKVDNEGNLVEKYVAYNEPTLDSVIENVL
jgi:thiol-disulfide isomerase/thioredoxin